MTLPWLVASFHLVALALGATAIHMRARYLSRLGGPQDLRSVFVADNLWGVAAVLWLGTGIWRAFGGLEKGTDYYLGHPLFHAKLGLFVLVVILEIRPMMDLIRWRRARSRGTEPDLSRARTWARISHIQLAIIMVMVFLATAIARNLRF